MCSIIYMALNQNRRGPPHFCGVITKGRAPGRCKHQWVIPSSLERLLKVDKKEREPLISQGLLESLPPKLPSLGNASFQAECQRNKFNQNFPLELASFGAESTSQYASTDPLRPHHGNGPLLSPGITESSLNQEQQFCRGNAPLDNGYCLPSH